jgi:hypothetical protein
MQETDRRCAHLGHWDRLTGVYPIVVLEGFRSTLPCAGTAGSMHLILSIESTFVKSPHPTAEPKEGGPVSVVALLTIDGAFLCLFIGLNQSGLCL